MAQLKNPKQEALAQGIFAGKTQLQAYKDAGYAGNTTAAATHAAQKPDVQVRIAELVRERHEGQRKADASALEKSSITKEWIVTRAKYITDRAIRGTKPIYDDKGAVTGYLPTGRDDGNAINALKLLAQMGGHLIERVELGHPGDFSRLSPEELKEQLILVGESIGIDPTQIQKAITGRAA